MDRLFSLSVMTWTFIQFLVCINSFFILLRSSILWDGYATVCLTIYLSKDIWTLSSLGLFKKNKGNMNTYVLLFVRTCFHFSGSHWWISSAKLYVNCIISFKRETKLQNSFPEWLNHFPFLPAMHVRLTSSPAFDFVTVFNVSLSDRHAVIVHYHFNCICLMANNPEHQLICLFAISNILFGKLFMSLVHFLIGLLNFYCWVVRVLYIPYLLVLCWIFSVSL